MELCPYVGITDFMDFSQVQAMQKVFLAKSKPGSNRKLHVGVMMSHNTLHGLRSKWQNAFPAKEKIAGIFSSVDTYNCLHYADYAGHPDFSGSLELAIGYAGMGLSAIQLDMIWPEPAEVANGIHASRRHIEVILQVGKEALEDIYHNPQVLVERLAEYDGIVHRVLLDRSCGEGVPMDVKILLPLARAVRENFPEMGLVVAGGLGPNTMHLAEPMIREFPDISIDAQGRLRPSQSALDPIDWDLAKLYLQEALKLLD